MTNYPPGVTGNEPQIAGPTSESEDYESRYCWDCDEEVEVAIFTLFWSSGGRAEWTCPLCHADNEEELYVDPDEYYADWEVDNR